MTHNLCMDNRMNYECIGIFKMSRFLLFTFCGNEHYSLWHEATLWWPTATLQPKSHRYHHTMKFCNRLTTTKPHQAQAQGEMQYLYFL